MLRLCLLSSLVLVAFAQSGVDPDLEAFETRFDDAQSVSLRLDQHFYCKGYVYAPENSTDDPVQGPGIDVPNDDNDVWTLWLQYPIIQFIDVTRKQVLFSLITDIIRSGVPDGDPLKSFGVDNICLGPYTQVDIYQYSESVLLYIYFRNTTSSTTSVSDVVDAFDRGLNTGTPAVVGFRSRTAIYLLGGFSDNTVDAELRPVVFNFTNNPPGSFFSNPRDDPTFNAVVVGSYPQRLSLREAGRDGRFRGFASNPNPINYGLEAGDYIFAVFGSFFLLIVGILTILGYFIDPFFLNM